MKYSVIKSGEHTKKLLRTFYFIIYLTSIPVFNTRKKIGTQTENFRVFVEKYRRTRHNKKLWITLIFVSSQIEWESRIHSAVAYLY